MEDEPTPNGPVTDPLVAAPSPVNQHGHRRRGKWLAQRVTELCTVFAGVYAAFMLNAHQIHRQETQRRAQLLNWLSGIYSEKLLHCKDEAAVVQKQSDEFNRRIDAGEMPPLYAFNWSSDYNPVDIAGLLQSGGYDLLDLDTIRAIKEEDYTLRSMVMVLQHDQQLSDALIVPNLGKGSDVFYDPATRRLRDSYQWYAKFYTDMLKSYPVLQKQVAEVVERLRAAQERNR